MRSSSFPVEWSGVYEYDLIPDLGSIPEPVGFELSLRFINECEFTGHVQDADDSPMQEVGIVTGKLDDGSIEFVKRMPIATFIEYDGSSSRSNDCHPPIYYNGSYVAEEKRMVGRWHILPKSAGVNEYSGVTGTWYAVATHEMPQ